MKTYESYGEALRDQVIRLEFSYSEAQQIAKLMNTTVEPNGVYPFGKFAYRFATALGRAERKASAAMRKKRL